MFLGQGLQVHFFVVAEYMEVGVCSGRVCGHEAAERWFRWVCFEPDTDTLGIDELQVALHLLLGTIHREEYLRLHVDQIKPLILAILLDKGIEAEANHEEVLD